MSRGSAAIPYAPGILTKGEDLSREVQQELYRIQQALSDLDRPTALTIIEEVGLQADPVPEWTRLFDSGLGAIWEQPSGQFDSATGVYTFGIEGLFNVYTSLVVPAEATPQVKSFIAALRVTFQFIDPAKPDVETTLTNQGLDDQDLTVQGQILYPFVQGDSFFIDAAIYRISGAALACRASLQVHRVSSIK